MEVGPFRGPTSYCILVQIGVFYSRMNIPATVVILCFLGAGVQYRIVPPTGPVRIGPKHRNFKINQRRLGVKGAPVKPFTPGVHRGA